ncbi:hypothetical protein PRVXT_001555 [Proteinivorax tanatarense]|uniref:Uncharacterized protein n=1 Tax=Proteinivorax tanatarense TaxID=1260629 RepID=A0AAU7VHN1_9FIRM
MKTERILEEMLKEYNHYCGSYVKFLSYISKIDNKDPDEITEEQEKEFERLKNKFRNKTERIHKFVKKYDI